MSKEMSFQKVDMDPAFRIGVGSSFHQPGTGERECSGK